MINFERIRKIKNKKGSIFLGEHTVNLVITVIAIVILLYLGFKILGIFTQKNELEKAGSQLEKISNVVKKVWESNIESNVDFFPIKFWFLRTFKDYDFPVGECRDNRIVSCLCICEDVSCKNPSKRKCEGFEFNVKVDEVYLESKTVGDPGSGLGKVEFIESEEIFKLREAIYELNIFKENDIVFIKELK